MARLPDAIILANWAGHAVIWKGARNATAFLGAYESELRAFLVELVAHPSYDAWWGRGRLYWRFALPSGRCPEGMSGCFEGQDSVEACNAIATRVLGELAPGIIQIDQTRILGLAGSGVRLSFDGLNFYHPVQALLMRHLLSLVLRDIRIREGAVDASGPEAQVGPDVASALDRGNRSGPSTDTSITAAIPPVFATRSRGPGEPHMPAPTAAASSAPAEAASSAPTEAASSAFTAAASSAPTATASTAPTATASSAPTAAASTAQSLAKSAAPTETASPEQSAEKSNEMFHSTETITFATVSPPTVSPRSTISSPFAAVESLVPATSSPSVLFSRSPSPAAPSPNLETPSLHASATAPLQAYSATPLSHETTESRSNTANVSVLPSIPEKLSPTNGSSLQDTPAVAVGGKAGSSSLIDPSPLAELSDAKSPTIAAGKGVLDTESPGGEQAVPDSDTPGPAPEGEQAVPDSDTPGPVPEGEQAVPESDTPGTAPEGKQAVLDAESPGPAPEGEQAVPDSDTPGPAPEGEQAVLDAESPNPATGGDPWGGDMSSPEQPAVEDAVQAGSDAVSPQHPPPANGIEGVALSGLVPYFARLFSSPMSIMLLALGSVLACFLVVGSIGSCAESSRCCRAATSDSPSLTPRHGTRRLGDGGLASRDLTSGTMVEKKRGTQSHANPRRSMV